MKQVLQWKMRIVIVQQSNVLGSRLWRQLVEVVTLAVCIHACWAIHRPIQFSTGRNISDVSIMACHKSMVQVDIKADLLFELMQIDTQLVL